MRFLSLALLLISLFAVSLMPAAASEIRQASYTYSHEFAKDPGSDTVYSICDACPSASRLALKPKDIQIAIKVVIPEPKKTPEPRKAEPEGGVIREKNILIIEGLK